MFGKFLLSRNARIIGPLLKIAALLATGTAVHLSLSPPNPPAPPEQLLASKSIFERWVRYVTFCSKVGSTHLCRDYILAMSNYLLL